MSNTEIEHAILNCFDGTEWHLSLWFPKVARAVVGLPPDPADRDVQSRLLDLIARGQLEAGIVDGADFAVRPLEFRGPCCPDLYVRTVEPR